MVWVSILLIGTSDPWYRAASSRPAIPRVLNDIKLAHRNEGPRNHNRIPPPLHPKP